jgi:putative tricarboxylic transport membrane protein
MERKKKWGDLVAAIVVISLGVGVAVEALWLKLGTATTPQPGFFPFLSGIFLTALGCILLVQAVRGLSTGTKPLKFWGPPAIVIGALCVYVALFSTVGYVIAMTLLGMVILYVLETRTWRTLILASLAVSLVTYVLFDKILEVPLPNGFLKPFF